MTELDTNKLTRVKVYFLLLLKIFISVSVFLLIAHNIDLSRTMQLLQGASLALLGVAFCALTVQALLAVVRWRWILITQGCRFDYFRLVRFYWLGLFFNQLLPSSVGGDAMRAYCLVRNGCSIGKASVVVLLDRAIGLVGLILLVLVCQPFSFEFLRDDPIRWGVLWVTLGGATAFGAVLVLDRLTSCFRSSRILHGVVMFSRAARRALVPFSSGLLLLALSVAIHLISIFAVIIIALGMGIEPHWLAFFIVVPLTSLFMALPISIGGWGVREGVMVLGLGYAGIQPENALALSVLYGLLLLILTLPGALAWLVNEQRT